MDAWRIKRVPYDQFGHWQYTRVYGWGWCSPIGAVALIVGTVGLVTNVKIDDGWLAGMVGVGFIMIWTGALLNGFSERKMMSMVDA